jgi:hypothetical protein
MMVSGARPRRADDAHLRAAGPYIDQDAVFGKRDSLVVDFDAHPARQGADGRLMDEPYHSASYDFRLAPNATGTRHASTVMKNRQGHGAAHRHLYLRRAHDRRRGARSSRRS